MKKKLKMLVLNEIMNRGNDAKIKMQYLEAMAYFRLAMDFSGEIQKINSLARDEYKKCSELFFDHQLRD